MGFAERVLARTAPEKRAITEWGSSAIPGPLGNLTGGGGSYSSVDLRRAEASLQKVAVWSAVDLIAGVASQLPLQTFQTQPDGIGKVMPSNPQLVEDPGGEDQGAGDWIYQYLSSKLLRGNAYGTLASLDSRYGTPTQIILYHPDDVSGYRDPTTGAPVWRVNGRELPPGQKMWHRRAYPSPGQLLGLSPVGQHATTIGQGISAARFGQQFFTDGGHPTALLVNSEEEIDQKKAVEVKARWVSAVWGAREPVTLGRGWDYKPLAVSPEESQFLETQKFTGAECCRIFGPNIAEILGYETGGSMTYANQEQRAIDFLKFTLNRWLRDIETVFTKYLPKPQYVRFDRKVLLETDLLSRYQAHQIARNIGLQNVDEQRIEEDLSPLPNGQGQDYTPLLVQVAASRGIDAAQVHAGEPASDQPATRGGVGPKGEGAEARKFDPAEPRDPHSGKWSKTGGAVHDALKLAGRIKLGQDEHLAGSAKVGDGRGDYSTVMARVDGPGGPRIRFGVVDTYEGTKKWRASNGGATVVLDEHGAGELRRVIADAQAKGPKSVSDYRADIKARHARGEPESEWPSPEADIAKGTIRGSAWGDIEWTLTREEGPDFSAGGVNYGPGGKWLLSLDVKAADNQLGPLDSFDIYSPSVAQKLDDALARLMEAPGNATRAAGHDTTPGHDQLHHYWTKGEGLAKWAESPKPYTTLYGHLVKFMPPGEAHRAAAAWFHEVFGFWPGSDLNRVTHGKPPRGHRIGPG